MFRHSAVTLSLAATLAAPSVVSSQQPGKLPPDSAGLVIASFVSRQQMMIGWASNDVDEVQIAVNGVGSEKPTGVDHDVVGFGGPAGTYAIWRLKVITLKTPQGARYEWAKTPAWLPMTKDDSTKDAKDKEKDAADTARARTRGELDRADSLHTPATAEHFSTAIKAGEIKYLGEFKFDLVGHVNRWPRFGWATSKELELKAWERYLKDNKKTQFRAQIEKRIAELKPSP